MTYYVEVGARDEIAAARHWAERHGMELDIDGTYALLTRRVHGVLYRSGQMDPEHAAHVTITERHNDVVVTGHRRAGRIRELIDMARFWGDHDELTGRSRNAKFCEVRHD